MNSLALDRADAPLPVVAAATASANTEAASSAPAGFGDALQQALGPAERSEGDAPRGRVERGSAGRKAGLLAQLAGSAQENELESDDDSAALNIANLFFVSALTPQAVDRRVASGDQASGSEDEDAATDQENLGQAAATDVLNSTTIVDAAWNVGPPTAAKAADGDSPENSSVKELRTGGERFGSMDAPPLENDNRTRREVVADAQEHAGPEPSKRAAETAGPVDLPRQLQPPDGSRSMTQGNQATDPKASVAAEVLVPGEGAVSANAEPATTDADASAPALPSANTATRPLERGRTENNTAPPANAGSRQAATVIEQRLNGESSETARANGVQAPRVVDVAAAYRAEPTPSRGTRSSSASPVAERVASQAATRIEENAAPAQTRRDTSGFGHAQPEPERAMKLEKVAVTPSMLLWNQRELLNVIQSAAAPTLVESAMNVERAVEEDLSNQIVQSIKVQASAGGGEVKVRLRPEYLGELSVSIKLDGNNVTASLQSSTPAVRQWIETNEASLRQGLADLGLHLDRLIVSDEAAASEPESGKRQQSPSQEETAQQGSRRLARNDEDVPVFEVVA